MAKQILTERVADLGGLRAVRAAGKRLPYAPLALAHIYVKLDFKQESENAASLEEARGFLRSVARASIAAQHIADQYGGLVLEVQGSTLHVGLPMQPGASLLESANSLAADIHSAYQSIFHDQQKRVQGWRMTVDTGKTLVVIGRGVHNDDSYISLGKSANRPAKHLYSQLAIPKEEDRKLKRFFVAVRRSSTTGPDVWDHFSLERSKSRLAALTKIAEEARTLAPNITFIEAVASRKQATARALPVPPPGTSSSPSPEDPHTYFGWVMRADLDGFTARVEACFDNDEALRQLGHQFYELTETAAEFVERNKETLAQLPWAGDNFTAAAVFSTKPEYDAAIPRRLLELTLDFEKDMAHLAEKCGFGGWAHGVAGGKPVRNSVGNVYLAGVEVDGRRFLVGVGEGFGRSTQAFGDINPKAKQVVVYTPDWERMEDSYKKAFEPAVTVRKELSSLYHSANVDGLMKVRAREASTTSFTTIDFPGEPALILPTKQHY